MLQLRCCSADLGRPELQALVSARRKVRQGNNCPLKASADFPASANRAHYLISASGPTNRALPGPVDYLQIPELAERGLARVQQFFVTLDDPLASHQFLATDRFSIADITAVVAVDFARIVKVKPGEEHPHLGRWRAKMAQRPAMSL